MDLHLAPDIVKSSRVGVDGGRGFDMQRIGLLMKLILKLTESWTEGAQTVCWHRNTVELQNKPTNNSVSTLNITDVSGTISVRISSVWILRHIDPDDGDRDGPWNVGNFYPTDTADCPRIF
jgi:hypothetical protein